MKPTFKNSIIHRLVYQCHDGEGNVYDDWDETPSPYTKGKAQHCFVTIKGEFIYLWYEGRGESFDEMLEYVCEMYGEVKYHTQLRS